MDTSDPNIIFDERGICDYCNNFLKVIQPNWDVNEKGKNELLGIATKIKEQGKGKKFDCIIGLSGGLDSSYTAYVAKELMGLRPLLLHVDAGWNTEQAVGNIEKLVDGLGLDLHTDVVDQDLPQDAAFFSALYKFARKHQIKYILTGSNYSTECCREPEEWGGYPGIDKRLFRDICDKFASRSLNKFPLVDILIYKIYYRYVWGLEVIKPLNLVPYIKKDAEELLMTRFGWQRFLHKHHESRFTRFYEDYWMPRKFGYEKRRAHFSSLIMTAQMTREAALKRISQSELDEHFVQQEFEYVARKLGVTVSELATIFEGENKTYHVYKNKMPLIRLGSHVMQMLGLEKRLFR